MNPGQTAGGAGSDAAPDAPQPDPSLPVLRVLAGQPSAEDLAALVVVLAAVGGAGEDEPAPRRPSAWADPAWQLVGPRPASGGWRASSLPR